MSAVVCGMGIGTQLCIIHTVRVWVDSGMELCYMNIEIHIPIAFSMLGSGLGL